MRSMDASHGPSSGKSPFSIKNVRLFIAFRLCFNARFYYPVFTILFLDFGLTVSQFAILNAAWAATIVVMEVPSGAFADALGRRTMLVMTGGLMVVEVALLCFVPRGHAGLLFNVFLMNRVLSGIAEASASGADEALAYDSLKKEGLASQWGRVLEVQMRVQSIGAVLAMVTGAAVYDPQLMQRVAAFLGIDLIFTQAMTLRFPLFLTLAMAVATLFIALRMRDVEEGCMQAAGDALVSCSLSIREALGLTLKAGLWILKTPFALVVIAGGLLFDGIIRMVITLSSQYFRLIQLPEASFGLIGAAISGMGIFIPRIALAMTKSRSPLFNFAVVAVLATLGLTGMAFFFPVAGLVPSLVLFGSMYLVSFFVSNYLNHLSDSSQRATVLSFKGLAFNLSYGGIGVAYSLLLAHSRGRLADIQPGVTGVFLENRVFVDTFAWFPIVFLIALAVLVCFAYLQLRNSDIRVSVPDDLL